MAANGGERPRAARRRSAAAGVVLAAAAAAAGLGFAPAAGGAGSGGGGVPEPVRAVVRDMTDAGEAGAIVRPSPAPGFYEVLADGGVFYVSEDGRFLFHGALYDVADRRNLTEDAHREARSETLRQLDEDTLIVFAPASSQVKHTVTVFTDVDCPYCARFHLEVPELNARGVEVRYAAWPRTPEGTPSYARSVSVWCASDRRRAMTAAKAGEEVAPASCDNPVQAHFDLGRRLGVRGTPTIVADDGMVFGGYVPYRELVRALEQG